MSGIKAIEFNPDVELTGDRGSSPRKFYRKKKGGILMRVRVEEMKFFLLNRWKNSHWNARKIE